MPLYNPPADGGSHPDLATHDALGLATDTELGDHGADTTSVHGIADTSDLSLTSHDHDADYEAAGGIATHSADTTSVHGVADTSVLATDAEVATAVSDHAAAADPHSGYLKEADFDDVDFLVGTATGHTGAEIVVGTSPGGELGGTWASPTVDATHSGSTHGAAVTTHEAAGDPHTGYRLESADHSHATTGLQGGTVAHSATTGQTVNDHHPQAHTHPAEGAVVVTHASTTGQTANDHHAQAHAADHLPTGTDPENKFSQSTIGTADQAIANTETVVTVKVMAANELTAGMMFRFEAWFTKAGTNASSAVIRIRIGTTTLTGNIAATLTPPANALAVPGKIEGLVWIVSAGAGGTARGSLQQFVHLAAVTITSAISPATATVAVNTTSANQRVELTFISGNAANTYTFRNAVMYRVA